MTKLIGFLLLVLSVNVQAENRIVYGDDSRVDIKKIYDSRIQNISKSVAGRVYNYSFNTVINDDTRVSFDQVLPLSHPRAQNICKEEKFASQPTASDCTGFLIAEDLLVTAGHCAVKMGETVVNESTYECETHSWVFDYREGDGPDTLNLKNFDSSKIYGCSKVIHGVWEEENDFALIQLDRKVLDRKPLKLSRNGSVKRNTPLFVIGHPSGLPLKYADGAKVFDVKKDYFSTNLDVFGGNSGSPVFNKHTLEVEGILVRGDVDYVEVTKDDGSFCLKVNHCDNNRENCEEDDKAIKGEHVTNIANVIKIL